MSESPATRYLKRLKPSSRKSQRFALRRALVVLRAPVDPEQFPWHLLTTEHVEFLVRTMPSMYSSSTVHVTTSAIRCVLVQSHLMGLMDLAMRDRLIDILRSSVKSK